MFPQTLRVASYNIRKAVGTDRRRDPGRILRIIRSFDANIVMLQEVDKRLPPRPPALPVGQVQELTGLVPVQFRHDTPSLGEHGNALLIDPRLSVEDSFSFDLPSFEPRGVVGTRLRAPDGRSLVAVGLHFGLLRRTRRQQTRALLDWLDMSDMAGLPTIIAGDLNERSQTKGLGELHRRMTLLPARNSFHSRLLRWPLDRIAVSHHFRATPPQVIQNKDTRRASDHLPILADLEWLPSDCLRSKGEASQNASE